MKTKANSVKKGKGKGGKLSPKSMAAVIDLIQSVLETLFISSPPCSSYRQQSIQTLPLWMFLL